MITDKRTLTVTGTAFYAKVQSPDKQYNMFAVDLVVDEKTSDKLKELGAKPATSDGLLKRHEGHPDSDVYKFKRRVVTKDGTHLSPPEVVDSKGRPTKKLVGNGSKVKLNVTLMPYTYNSKKGVSLYLNGLQVLDLVEYNTGPMFKEEAGTFVDDNLGAAFDEDI